MADAHFDAARIWSMLAPRLEGKRVLVVDDDHATCDLLRAILRHQGAGVEAVTNGEQALYRIQETHFDAFVIDLILPGVSGFALLQRIEVTNPGRCCAVVISASKPSVYLTALGSAAVYSVIPKPFDIFELLKAIKGCCDDSIPPR